LRALARASRDGTRPSLETIDTATDSLGDLLERMRRVLAEMRKLETYQEALKLLKQIIDDEEKLLEKTREQRKRDLIKKLNGAGLGDDSQPGEKAVPEADKVKR
jgi:CHASE3 domain sensor protein